MCQPMADYEDISFLAVRELLTFRVFSPMQIASDICVPAEYSLPVLLQCNSDVNCENVCCLAVHELLTFCVFSCIQCATDTYVSAECNVPVLF